MQSAGQITYDLSNGIIVVKLKAGKMRSKSTHEIDCQELTESGSYNMNYMMHNIAKMRAGKRAGMWIYA